MQFPHTGRLAALAAMLLASASCHDAATEARAHNLLFVSIDTLRADHLSCYGYERETSPHLDALAARSQRFENAWSVMPTTLPSHTAMFTSLYPAMLGTVANDTPVTPAAHTLAERLSEHGFATGAFVSAAPLHPDFGLAQGFSIYDHPSGPQRRGDETRERATRWLRAHQRERFFCFVHLFDPHTWYDAPERERALFGAVAGPQPPERVFLSRKHEFGPSQRAAFIDAYDAEVRFADEQIGRLLEELEALGLSESTLVVVTSDHGETLDELIDAYGYGYDHGEFLHRRELRVPLVIHVPGADQVPRVHAQAISTLDLMPTLLDLLGLPADDGLLGRSLSPLLHGHRLPPRPVFAQRRALRAEEVRTPPSPFLVGDEFSVASEAWHFVAGQGRPEELYDLDADPAATRNVAAEQPVEVARLRELLDQWRAARATVRSSGAEVSPPSIEPRLLEALRALGYATD